MQQPGALRSSPGDAEGEAGHPAVLTNPNITKNAQAARSSWEGEPWDSPETPNPVSESFLRQ